MRKLAFALALALFVCLAGAETEITDIYEAIDMASTREALEAEFAEYSYEGEYMLIEGSALCAFYENGRLRAKSRAFESIRELASLCPNDVTLAKQLKQGAPLEDLERLLGCAGAEFMRINVTDAQDSGVQRLLAWQNANGLTLEALFELDDGEWRLLAAVEIGGE